jgi:hypothetical protein
MHNRTLIPHYNHKTTTSFLPSHTCSPSLHSLLPTLTPTPNHNIISTKPTHNSQPPSECSSPCSSPPSPPLPVALSQLPQSPAKPRPSPLACNFPTTSAAKPPTPTSTSTTVPSPSASSSAALSAPRSSLLRSRLLALVPAATMCSVLSGTLLFPVRPST